MFSLSLQPDLNGKVSLNTCDEEQLFCASVCFPAEEPSDRRNAAFFSCPANVLLMQESRGLLGAELRDT